METFSVMVRLSVINGIRICSIAILSLCLSTNLFASERVIISLDRSCYVFGETIWLRGWLIEAGNTHETPSSKFLYVELLRDGLGSVEQRIKLKERSGMFFGQMELDENLETGYPGLYVIGDGSGVTHSLSHASASGVHVARQIIMNS